MKRIYISFCILLFACCLFSTTPVQASSYDAKEWKLLELTNKERMKVGLQPLSTNTKLQTASKTRAKELHTSFSHTRPNGTGCFTVLTKNGIPYHRASENIASGYSSPKAVLRAWMKSPSHRASLLNKNSYQHVGSGRYKNNWEQLFVGGCKIKKLTITTPKNLTLYKGESLESLGLTVSVKCSQHGTSVMPLISEMASGFQPNKLGKQKVKVTYGKYKTTFTVTVVKKKLSNCTFSKIKTQAYTGKAIKPKVVIKDKAKTLVKDKDYTVSYKNNKKPGTATVTITGKGNYKGTKTLSFRIHKK